MNRFYLPVVGTFLVTQVAIAAPMRDGGDPPFETVIWADPFDWYTQWNWNERNNAARARGTLWQGGPMPAGVAKGSLPLAGLPDKAPFSTVKPCTLQDAAQHQTSPALHEMARAQWLGPFCGPITTPGGMITDGFDSGRLKIAYGGGGPRNNDCYGDGQTANTLYMEAQADYTWGQGGTYSAMQQFTRNFLDRIQQMDPLKNSVNGTAEHPLVFNFYLRGGQAGFKNNSYLELNFNGDHAPTDYVWRGTHYTTCAAAPGAADPECCVEGPYPIICQQVYETNGDDYETGADTTWLLGQAPGTGGACPQIKDKTWSAIAFGYLAIMDKQPCKTSISTGHIPRSYHYAVFDGHVWRKIFAGRYHGLINLKTGLPVETSPINNATNGTGNWFPQDKWFARNPTPGTCGDFQVGAGANDEGKNDKVFLKITDTDILIYVENTVGGVAKFWGAAVPRAYTGAFNRVSFGVAPGCELDPATGNCKEGGTPKQCLTYSRGGAGTEGYWRTYLESPIIYDGELQYQSDQGACCLPTGVCSVTEAIDCTAAGGVFRGSGTACAAGTCLGACCQGIGQCSEVAHGTCEGDDKGIGTRCATTSCPCTQDPHVWADSDQDLDVDHDDFGAFQKCFTGGDTNVTPNCHCFDRVPGAGINGEDFTAFEKCITGPARTYSLGSLPPGCTP